MGDVGRHVRELFVQASKDIEHKGPIGDDFTKIAEGIGHGFEFVVVLGDGQIPLFEIPELSIKDESPSFLVADELFEEVEPDGA